MPITVASSVEGTTTVGVTSLAVSTSGMGLATGDLLVVVTVVWRGTSISMVTPTDNQSGVYTQRVAGVWDSTFNALASIHDTIVGAIAPTAVTVRSSANTGLSGVLLRITGHQPGGAFVGSFASAKQTAANPTSPSIEVADRHLALAVLTHDAGSSPALDVPAGYTLLQEEENTTLFNPYCVGWKRCNAGTEAPAWVAGTSADYHMLLGSYLPNEIIPDYSLFPRENMRPTT